MKRTRFSFFSYLNESGDLFDIRNVGVGYFLGWPAQIVNTEKTTVTTTIGRSLILFFFVSVDVGGGDLGSYLVTTETQ